jgi:hypothetical protein
VKFHLSLIQAGQFSAGNAGQRNDPQGRQDDTKQALKPPNLFFIFPRLYRSIF